MRCDARTLFVRQAGLAEALGEVAIFGGGIHDGVDAYRAERRHAAAGAAVCVGSGVGERGSTLLPGLQAVGEGTGGARLLQRDISDLRDACPGRQACAPHAKGAALTGSEHRRGRASLEVGRLALPAPFVGVEWDPQPVVAGSVAGVGHKLHVAVLWCCALY